jgi:O-antigen/teichoic acid export membrane protein
MLARVARWIRAEVLQAEPLRRTGKDIALTFTGQACFSASKFVTLLVLSRYLGASRFAVCAVYVTSSLVLVNLCELGINITALKFLATPDMPRWRRTAARFMAVRFWLTLLITGAAALLGALLCRYALHHPEYTTAFRLSCAAAAWSSTSGFLLTLLQSRRQFTRIATINVGTAVLQLTPAFLAVFLRWDAVAALLLGEIMSRSAVLLGCRALLRDLWRGFLAAGDRPRYREIAGFANWISASVLIGAVQGYIPTVALSRWSQPAALAVYAMGSAMASGFGLLMTTTCLVLLPQAMSSRTTVERLRYAVAYLKSGAAVCVAMSAAAWVASPLAAPMFSHDLRPAIEVFRILAIASIVLIALNPVQFLLYSMNRPDLCTASDALIAAMFAVMAAWLAPRYGANGVAVALLVGQTAVKAGTAWGILMHLKKKLAICTTAELEPEYSGAAR